MRGLLLPETLDDYGVRVTSQRDKVPPVTLTIIFILYTPKPQVDFFNSHRGYSSQIVGDWGTNVIPSNLIWLLVRFEGKKCFLPSNIISAPK